MGRITGHIILSRYVCDALDEMRNAVENLNTSSIYIARRHLRSLIEEVQTAVNRMENALDARDNVEDLEIAYLDYKKDLRALKKEIRELTIQKYNLEEELEENAEH
jgi:predicted  nucleic acid-binding Zn-ribbon protein